MAHFYALCREWCVLRSFLPGRQRNGTFTFFSRFSRGRAVSPAARASHGNADHDRHAMGKNRERIRFSPRPGRRGSPGEGRTCRTRRAARRLSRLLRGEISSCGASWRGAGTRAFRSEIARRHAGGPRLSRPYPRRPRPPPHVGLGA